MAEVNETTGRKFIYSDIIEDHFFNPRNILKNENDAKRFDTIGEIGSPACGDVMKVYLKIKDNKIIDFKWKTFGCGSAIAATSMFSVMVTENDGLTLTDALKIKPQDIMERLGGLPNRKIHCSVLADKAFRKAVNNYFHAVGKHDRVEVEGARVIDARMNITDKDIEEAVLEGALNLEDMQKKLKVGVGDPAAIPEIEQLIRFYKEKYFGA